MASVNKVIIIGNLGADPEVKYTQGGTAVANMRIATNESWTDKQGNKQDRTEWHRCVAWGKTGELCAEYLSKGRSVYLEGRLQTREWTDKDGRKNYSTEIIADRVVFLSTGAGQGSGRNDRRNDDGFGAPPPGFDEPSRSSQPGPSDDDLPF